MNNESLEYKMQVFFLDPKKNIKPPSYFGVLYLLRRDVYRCMGFNTRTWEIDRKSIIWPGAMTVLAGIDLLAKFYCGNDVYNLVGQRFKKYVSNFIDSENAEVIYQLRNSMLHSFGLLSKTKDSKIRFTVSSERKELVEKYTDTHYKVDLYTLWHRFEKSILDYKNEIEHNDVLKENFELIFDEYGYIIIG